MDNLNNFNNPIDGENSPADEDIRSILNNHSSEFKQRDEMQEQAKIPTKEYEQMNGTSILISDTTKTHNRVINNRKMNIYLILIGIVLLLSILLLINVNKFATGTKDLTKNGIGTYVETDENKVTIEQTTISYKKNDGVLTLKIENNGNYEVKYNAYGTYMSNGYELYPAQIDQNTNLNKYAFESPIKSNMALTVDISFSKNALNQDIVKVTGIIINGNSYDISFIPEEKDDNISNKEVVTPSISNEINDNENEEILQSFSQNEISSDKTISITNIE